MRTFKVGEWIQVTDCVPAVNVRVLCVTQYRDGAQYTAICALRKCGGVDMHEWAGVDLGTATVTHWQPIPAAPAV